MKTRLLMLILYQKIWAANCMTEVTSVRRLYIKRVKLIRRADGYYCQFCISVDVKQDLEPIGKAEECQLSQKDAVSDKKSPTPL